MGFTDDIRNILRTVKEIPHIPGEVVDRLTRRLRELEKTIKHIDVAKFASTIVGNIRKIVQEEMDGVENYVDEQTKSTREWFSRSIDNIQETVTKKFADVEGMVGDIPELFNNAVATIQKTILEPINGFFHKYFLPLLIGAIIIVISPVLSPFISFIL